MSRAHHKKQMRGRGLIVGERTAAARAADRSNGRAKHPTPTDPMNDWREILWFNMAQVFDELSCLPREKVQAMLDSGELPVEVVRITRIYPEHRTVITDRVHSRRAFQRERTIKVKRVHKSHIERVLLAVPIPPPASDEPTRWHRMWGAA